MAGDSVVMQSSMLDAVRAVHPYTACRPIELSFSAGDVLTLTKKDPSGWWEAEFNGKKGLIPSNFVEECAAPKQPSLPSLPALPLPLPTPPSPAPLQQLRKVAVEYNGEKHALQLPVSSLHELSLAIREELGIATPLTLSYFDADIDDFVVLKHLDNLPADKVPRIKVVVQAMSWWGWLVDSTSWTTKGFETTRYSSLLVKEGAYIHHQPALDKFQLVATQLGFDPNLATKVFAVSNEKLRINFENYRDTLYAKHRANPGLFRKDDWMTMSDAEQRKKFITYHSEFSDKFSWNDKTRPRVVPMLQGTSEGAVWQICQQGFGVVGTTDDGFYGAGVYFTSKLVYADKYAKSGADGSKPFIVSLVIPGNSFPVVEHPFVDPPVYEKDKKGTPVRKANADGYKGKACLSGYQSHFTLVDGRDINTAFPLRGSIDAATAADEMVTFEGAQALPLFVFYTK